MDRVPEAWLEDLNHRMGEQDIPHKQRPWMALMEWSKQTHSQFEIVGTPMADGVFQWFFDRSPAGSHVIPPLFTGLIYFDAGFWAVSVPRMYGTVMLDVETSLVSMPESVRRRLFA